MFTGEGNRLLAFAVEQVVSYLPFVLVVDEPLVEGNQLHAGVIVVDGEIREDSD